MENTKTITANTRLGVYVKQIDSNDKVLVISATNKFVKAKRTCGDVQTAYIELINVIKAIENKYGFVIFEPNVNIQAMIDEFAARVELGTIMVTGGTTYSCTFNSIEETNAWLACQKNIKLKNIQIETTGVGLKVRKVKFEYTVSEKPLNIKYQLEQNNKVRFFFGTKQEKFNSKWQKNNPQKIFFTSIKRKWGFSLIGGSVGYFRFIKEKYVVLYGVKCA